MQVQNFASQVNKFFKLENKKRKNLSKMIFETDWEIDGLRYRQDTYNDR